MSMPAQKDLISAIENLFKTNLGVRKGERLLVFSDNIREKEKISQQERKRREELLKIAEKTFRVGAKITNTTFVSYDATLSHGAEPPELLWKEAFGKKIHAEIRDKGILIRLINKKAEKKDIEEVYKIIEDNRNNIVEVVVAMANYSVSHTKFRDLLTKCAGTRFASLPLFDPSMFLTSMAVNWNLISSRTIKIADKLSRAKKAKIISPNGTELTIGLQGRKGIADTGILKSKGAFGNLPAGEAFIAPVEGTTAGKLVIEWGPTEKIVPPVVLEIKDGKVFIVRGISKFASKLRDTLEENPLNKNIAELGIGTNYKASKLDNILEAEKIAGTIHIALGDNMSFGGRIRTSFHQDFIFLEPTLTLEYDNGKSEVIVDNGGIIDIAN